MSCLPKSVGPAGAVLGAIVAALLSLPALAQSDDQADGDSRGVRIIDAPTPPGSGGPQKSPGTEAAAPPILTPAMPSRVPAAPTLTPPVATTKPVLTPSQPNSGPSQKSSGTEAAAPPILTPAMPSGAPAPPTLTPPAAAVRPILTLPQPVAGETRPVAPVLVPPAPELRPAPEAPAPPTMARPNSVLGTGASVPAAPVLSPPPSTPSLQPPSRPAPNDVSPARLPAPDNIADLPQQLTREDVEAISSGLKIPNAAGVSMQILPGPDIAAGSQVSFQISSKKAGYLILVDVDATGKLVQIYPNPMSLLAPGGVRGNVNLLRPGKSFRVPDRENVYSGFEFIASPPSGTAMVVAILSDRPVQRVDLPDVPVSMAGRASAADYLAKLANELRIPDASGNGRLEEPHWSFDAKFYAIR
jgi:hypothetical protein